jgi:hypothetical protein
MSEPTSVVGVEDKEECNKSAGSTDWGRSQEAVVTKRKADMYKAANLKAWCMKMSREGRREWRKTLKELTRWRWRQEKKRRLRSYVGTWQIRKSTRLETREDKQNKGGSGVADQAEAVENHTNGRTRKKTV